MKTCERSINENKECIYSNGKNCGIYECKKSEVSFNCKASKDNIEMLRK